MVGRSHPLVEIETQSTEGNFHRYTMRVGAVTEKQARRKAKFYLTRLWGVKKTNVVIGDSKSVDKPSPSPVMQGQVLSGPLSSYIVEGTVAK